MLSKCLCHKFQAFACEPGLHASEIATPKLLPSLCLLLICRERMQVQSTKGISIKILHWVWVVRLPRSCGSSTSSSPVPSESLNFLLPLVSHHQVVNATTDKASQYPSCSYTSCTTPGSKYKTSCSNDPSHTNSYPGTRVLKSKRHPRVDDTKSKKDHLCDFSENGHEAI